jgi:hypothetical protein
MLGNSKRKYIVWGVEQMYIRQDTYNVIRGSNMNKNNKFNANNTPEEFVSF